MCGGVSRAVRLMCHCFGGKFRDLRKTQLSCQKKRDGGFVGAVERCRAQPAPANRRTAERQSAERRIVRRKKRQFAVRRQIQRLRGAGVPVRVRQRILDRDFHVRHAQLRQHGVVVELDHGVDDAFAVHHHVHAIFRDTEQPGGFDDFQPFVHHGSAVDGNFRAHRPVGVAQRLRGRDVRQLCRRPAEKRPAGRRQNQFAQRAVGRRGLQALENRAVLAVYRQNRDAACLRGLHDQRAARHQRLFVGQRDGMPGLDGGQRRPQPGDPDDGVQHDAAVGRCGGEHAVGTGQHPHREIGHAGAQIGRGGFVLQHGKFRPERANLRFHPLHIAPGRQRAHRHPVLLRHFQRLHADGAGRS